jgi:bifunctional non-homologous end joining protein LigD
MPLARLHAPFDHPDWIFEPKLDGFRAHVYIERGNARLVSRNGNTFKSLPVLTAALGPALPVRDAILDGEIVHLGPDGAPLFYDLMRRRTPQHYYAFDLLWLDGRDLRGLPLIERKSMLRALVPPQPSPVLYVDHVAESGTALFQAVCKRDVEGVVAKLAAGLYTPEETSWVKIKNPAYSQAEGRADFFDWPRASARVARANRYLSITVFIGQ